MNSLLTSARSAMPAARILKAAIAATLFFLAATSCQLPLYQTTVPVTGVALDRTTLEMTVGESIRLIATVSPAKASNKAVSWASSNSHARVTATGEVTAVSAGSAVITVTTLDGSFTSSCAVTVRAPVAVTGVSLDRASATLPYGSSLQLVATVLPSNAANKTVIWSSSGGAANVSSTGLVTASALGSALITARTQDGNFTATCSVTVIPSVSLDLTSVSLNAGQTRTLVATVRPASAPNARLLWTTSNENVAAVYEGKIIAVSAGTATITATAEDGGHSASCSVTVSGSLSHTYAQVFPAATALQNALNAAIASNDPSQSAYCVFVTTPSWTLTCYLNGYSSVGYSMTGTVVAAVNPDYSVGAMNGTVAFSGGVVSQISYHNANFAASTGTMGIVFIDGVSGTYNLATGVFTEN